MPLQENEYDVIIIGGGPSGIFASLALAPKGHKVLLLEKGNDLKQRECPQARRGTHCLHCSPCGVVSGWGGAGAFSDGKLTLTSDFGGFLGDYLEKDRLDQLIKKVDNVYLNYGAPAKSYGGDEKATASLRRQAAAAGLSFIPAIIRHMGTENCTKVLEGMYRELSCSIDIKTNTPVKQILVNGGKIRGVETDRGQAFFAPYVICAPGRDGSRWFYQEVQRLQLGASNNPVDIGVRVEAPAVVTEHLTSTAYESKLIYYAPTFDDRVRTFCMNPYGEVVLENYEDLLTVNGHSYAEHQTENTNFALLVSKNFTEPFNEPTRYGRYVASLANMLGGGVIIQRLGDLLAGRRSTSERLQRGLVRPTLKEATPGDLSLVLPYRFMVSLLEMINVLDKLAPGINSRHTLLYGVEVKFYSFRVNLNNTLETKIKNLFAVGDGAGITRGLVQASAAGMLVGEEIACRLEKDKA